MIPVTQRQRRPNCALQIFQGFFVGFFAGSTMALLVTIPQAIRKPHLLRYAAALARPIILSGATFGGFLAIGGALRCG